MRIDSSLEHSWEAGAGAQGSHQWLAEEQYAYQAAYAHELHTAVDGMLDLSPSDCIAEVCTRDDLVNHNEDQIRAFAMKSHRCGTFQRDSTQGTRSISFTG
jgi:hypothetical protein